MSYTESTVLINYPRAPVLALSAALAVRLGTSPLTIKYIWSPRVLGEATAGLSSLAPRPCLLSPTAPLRQGWAALGQGGEGVIIALETFEKQEGDSGAAQRGREEGPPLPPPASCALHRGGPPGAAHVGPPRVHGSRGAGGAEGVRSPSVIANSKGGRGDSWWQRRGGGYNSSWGVGLAKLLSLKKNRFIENSLAHPRRPAPAFLASPSCALWREGGRPSWSLCPWARAQDPDSLVSDSGWGWRGARGLQQRKPNALKEAWGTGGVVRGGLRSPAWGDKMGSQSQQSPEGGGGAVGAGEGRRSR